MKKIFTLLAMLGIAASMSAQTTYSFAGLATTNFTIDEHAVWNGTKLQNNADVAK